MKMMIHTPEDRGRSRYWLFPSNYMPRDSMRELPLVPEPLFCPAPRAASSLSIASAMSLDVSGLVGGRLGLASMCFLGFFWVCGGIYGACFSACDLPTLDCICSFCSLLFT